jgi:hypothetical protein
MSGEGVSVSPAATASLLRILNALIRKTHQARLHRETGFVNQKVDQGLRSCCDDQQKHRHCDCEERSRKQSRSAQDIDIHALLRRLRRRAMKTCFAHFVMKITQVRRPWWMREL